MKLAVPGQDSDLQAPIREYQVLRRLNHPNIIRAFWAGQLPSNDDEPGPTYVLLEHLQGQTLAEALAKGPLPIPEVVRIIEPVLDALRYLHTGDPGKNRQAIIHRDLKPENVFLTTSGPVIADFGSAAPQGEAGSAPLGTLSHAPPDLAEGGWDAAGDIFAIGCLLYRMVTGRFPWGNALPTTDSPPAPVPVDGQVTPRLAAFLERSVAPRRAERFASADEMAKALEAALQETVLPSRDETCMAGSLLSQPGEVSGATWDGHLLEAATSADDPIRFLARQLHGRLYSHETTDRRGLEDAFLSAEQRAFEFERPLPLAWQSLYDDLGAFSAPRPINDDGDSLSPIRDDLRLLVVDHLHPFELNLARGLAQRHGRSVRELVWTAGITAPPNASTRWDCLRRWLDLPEPEVTSDATSIASQLQSDNQAIWLHLPPGRRDRDRLAALLDQRLDLLEAALEPLLTTTQGPVWLTATSGCVHLGHGLRIDVGAELPAREAQAARSQFAARFGVRRCMEGSAQSLPSSTPKPTREAAGLQLVVGRLAWPDPPGAPVLATAGLSLAETLLPLLILEPAGDPR